MKIIPAIDLIDGKCVRLIQGDYNQKTIYSDNPLEVAKKFVDNQVELIHVVDLNGAKEGKLINVDIIKKLVENNIPIEIGGGIRNDKTVKMLFNLGVKRIILGSIAVINQNFLAEAVKRYGPEKIVLGLDCKNGYVNINGWLEKSKLKDIDMASIFKNFGGVNVIYTDISKDGMMTGVNFDAIKKLVNLYPELKIVASGGISSIGDIIKCKKIGCDGVIIGKAYYTGKINISEAIKKC